MSILLKPMESNGIVVHNDDLVPGLRRLVEAVHHYDSKIVMQLNRAGRQTSSSIIGEIPVAPSAVYYTLYEETPRSIDGR